MPPRHAATLIRAYCCRRRRYYANAITPCRLPLFTYAALMLLMPIFIISCCIYTLLIRAFAAAAPRCCMSRQWRRCDYFSPRHAMLRHCHYLMMPCRHAADDYCRRRHMLRFCRHIDFHRALCYAVICCYIICHAAAVG